MIMIYCTRYCIWYSMIITHYLQAMNCPECHKEMEWDAEDHVWECDDHGYFDDETHEFLESQERSEEPF